MEWYRSQLRRDASENLAGPCCQKGRDIVTLSEGNAMLASGHQIGEPRMASDGSIDRTPTEIPPVLNWNAPPSSQQNQGPTGALSVIVEAWLRGEGIAAVQSGIITRWFDQSGRNNDGVPTGAGGNSPSLATDTDGLPMAVFTSTQWLQGTNQQSSRPTWVWMICKVTANTNIQRLLRANVGFGQQFAATSNFNTVATAFSGSPPVAYTPGAWMRVIVSSDLADISATLQVGSVVGSAVGAGQNLSARYVLGAATAVGGNPFQGAVKELVMTAGIPTAAEIAAIDAYGVARYGQVPFA